MGVLLVGFLFLPTALLADGYPTPSQWQSCVSGCPGNAFQVTGSEPAFLEAWLRPLRELLTIALFAAATVSLALRMRSASPLVRLATGPVVGIAAARLVIFAVAIALRAIDPAGTPALAGVWLAGLFIPLITLAFLAGLLRWRLFVGASLARLAHDTGAYATLEQLRAALADAFRDPGLQIVERPPAAAGPGRVITRIPGTGSRSRRSSTTRRCATSARSRTPPPSRWSRSTNTLESQRLLREVEESRSRIAATADEERRRHGARPPRRRAAAARRVADPPRAGGEMLGEARPAAPSDRCGSSAPRRRPRSTRCARWRAASTRRRSRTSGLVEALRSAARRSPLPAPWSPRAGRYPRAARGAGYFCCLEALQNAAKHAEGASRITITIAERGGDLGFEVVDDGSGFDPARTERGAGLTNLEDRARAVGGDAIVESSAGRGTRLVIGSRWGRKPAPPPMRQARLIAGMGYACEVRVVDASLRAGPEWTIKPSSGRRRAT